MTKLIVDGKEIDVPAEYTLLQACEAAGAEIPRFCYHERLSIAGNCRMCLVEVKGGRSRWRAAPGACATAVRGRRGAAGISTRSPMVKKAREGVMEFLLDQPIRWIARSAIRAANATCRIRRWLRRRHLALRREQARGRRQISGRAGQDLDEPLHPVHALRPFLR